MTVERFVVPYVEPLVSQMGVVVYFGKVMSTKDVLEPLADNLLLSPVATCINVFSYCVLMDLNIRLVIP